MHTPPIKAASWVVLYDRGPVRVPDLDKTRQDHVMVLFLGRGCCAAEDLHGCCAAAARRPDRFGGDADSAGMLARVAWALQRGRGDGAH